MYTPSNKAKQFFFVLIKLSIVVGAFIFIYKKLVNNSSLDIYDFIAFLNKNHIFSIKSILSLLFLTFLNWFFEIVKWKNLINPIKKISFKKALQQSLGSLTASLFTPNRIGEYGAKAIFYKKENRKHVMLINLISNVMQMTITTLFGIIGLYFFINKFPLDMDYKKLTMYLLIGLFILAFIGLIIRKFSFNIKGFQIHKIIEFTLNFPRKIILIGFIFSLLRYLIFSFQFYFLLHIFGIEIDYLNAMIVITSMYFLASIIPSVFIFDVVIKGSVAVYLFSFLDVNELTVLVIVTLMWLLNLVIPSLVGSYYVLSFNFPKETVKA